MEDELLKALMATFRVEAGDHLQIINQALLKLERLPDDRQKKTVLQDAFRAAHSLKGAARAVNLQGVEAVAHSMESIFHQARDEGLALGADICDVLYDALDIMEQLLSDGDVDISSIQMRMAHLTAPHTAPEPVPMPESVVTPQAEVGVLPELHTEESIRVAVDKIDELMAQAGELLVAKISAEQHLTEMRSIRQQMEVWLRGWGEIVRGLSGHRAVMPIGLYEQIIQHVEYTQDIFEQVEIFHRVLNRDAAHLGMMTSTLQDSVRNVRMVPFQSTVFALERAVRDAARSENKQVQFSVTGADIEIDKKVLEILKDPLLHLVRNCVAHGVESPEDRTVQGKPATGSVNISVRLRGNEAHLAVQDDGRGFDLAALREAHARQYGGSVEDVVNDDDAIHFAFLPGVTTADSVTAISGRGVGLDVVQQSLGDIQGRVTVESVVSQGSTVHLVVPVSLAITRALLVRVGHEQYAVPLLAVEKIVEPLGAFVVGGRQMLNVDDMPLPLLSMAQVLWRPIPEHQLSAEPLALVIAVSNQRLALLVDDVLTEQELAVKPLSKPLIAVANVTGVAVMGDGSPVVVLNPAELVRSGVGMQHIDKRLVRPQAEATVAEVHVLVVDDSITTRMLERNILEAAEYRVTTATDGTEALARLREDNTIQLVVADVEMPHMDGITLTKTIRDWPEYADLPVILVTSLESREDKERGMLAGADAYIVKRGFDQVELLATIESLLGVGA